MEAQMFHSTAVIYVIQHSPVKSQKILDCHALQDFFFFQHMSSFHHLFIILYVSCSLVIFTFSRILDDFLFFSSRTIPRHTQGHPCQKGHSPTQGIPHPRGGPPRLLCARYGGGVLRSGLGAASLAVLAMGGVWPRAFGGGGLLAEDAPSQDFISEKAGDMG